MTLETLARRQPDEVWQAFEPVLPRVVWCGNGRPPNDPRRWEVGSVARHLLSLIEILNEDAKRFAPYRPLVNPWRNHGLAETLRPDFAARGLGRQDKG